MAGYFLDTSALAKAYHREAGTERVLKILSEGSCRFFISSLAIVELESALAQNLRAGALSSAQYKIARGKFGGDVRSGRLTVKGLFRRHLRSAEKLIVARASTSRLRTLDAIQLAMAVELRAKGLLDHLVVADERLAQIASFEGLSIINPTKQ